jgi:fused signal recognition particle receptor
MRFPIIGSVLSLSSQTGGDAAPGSPLPHFFQRIFELTDPWLARLEGLTGLERSVTAWIFPLSAVFILALVLMLFGWLIRKISGEKGSSSEAAAVKEHHEESHAAEAFDAEHHPETTDDAGETGMDEALATTAVEPEPIEKETPKPSGILRSIRSGLEKTRKALSDKMDLVFSGGGKLDDDKLEELEEMLITADVGVETSIRLIETLKGRKSEIEGPEDLKRIIREEIHTIIDLDRNASSRPSPKPRVIMVIGVNGVGKTTTIGKLASRFVKEGKKVLIVAADTFRAAASEQLAVWAERCGADIVRHKDNSDPASVAFDGMEAAVSRGVDIVMIDTAGRLHTKKNLMEELKKIQRIVSSKIPDAPHETLMVLDATTGQNALQQAKLFNEAIGVTTIALTKLDGTAKGGIVIGISHSLKIPISYIGVGEQIDDLRDFDAREFADALV